MTLHRYSSLRTYSDKQHKFQYRKSVPYGWDTHLSRGACVVASLHWLDAKIHQREPFIVTADRHSGNRDLLMSLENPHSDYLLNGYTVEQLIYYSDFQLQLASSETGLANGAPEGGLTDAVVAAQRLGRAATLLGPGRGALVGLNVEGANGARTDHVVAIFRSANYELFFFDSTCGEYRVTHPNGFFTEWARITRARFVAGRHVWFVMAR